MSPRTFPNRVLFLLLALGQFVVPTKAAEPGPLQFRLTFAKTVSAHPFTGRVYVMLFPRRFSGLLSPDWFDPKPLFARDVRNWKPGEPLILDHDALGFPTPLAKLARGAYWVQAVMDFDRGAQSFSDVEGNGFSRPLSFRLDPDTSGPIVLTIDRVFHAPPFRETDTVKLVDIKSSLLSEFHHRPVHLRAAVMLPRSFADQPTKRYPVVYEIPGFGGDHFNALDKNRLLIDVSNLEMLHVVLDPTCRTGHHTFADSENNGPYGRALTEELIPALENRFRGLGAPAARLLAGHSSGGWSSLWLQVSYPDFFGGTWSTAPDEVDFRDFQRTNIYQRGVNLFVDEQNRPRRNARGPTGAASLFNRPFSDMEMVFGHGGQLGSYEAVYSPRGTNGRPRLLWDRQTGTIDPAVAAAWQKYDIRRKLERNWIALAPKLAGKLHVYVGSEDTFYLEIAVGMLKESLSRLGSDAVVDIIPGHDHDTLIGAVRPRIVREMTALLKRPYQREK
jgi:hypothetical protein